MRNIYLIVICSFITLMAWGQENTQQIDLSGEWKFQIDSMDRGIIDKWYSQDLPETIKLPGSMAINGKGKPVGYDTEWTGSLAHVNWYQDEKYQPYLSDNEFLFPFWLIPDKHYVGAAWYQKEINIPFDWEGKNIELFLERCHWETQVWIDDQKVGMQNSLGVPHRFELTNFVKPGKHKITICVDNRIKDINVGVNSHSVTDHTQSNWNGIVGEIRLLKTELIAVSTVQVYPNVKNKTIAVELNIKNLSGEKKLAKIKIQAESTNTKTPQIIGPLFEEVVIKDTNQIIAFEYPMGENVLYWDEFNPNLYKLSVDLDTKSTTDKKEVTFGMREFKVDGTRFAINGQPVFLRGTLECAIFPKTGYPPTDVATWKRIINTCRDHGLNHIRFHSWCPPKAAFIAADELGFYYQVECSSWANDPETKTHIASTIGYGLPLDKWLYEESERMVNAYGNHPSFCMMVYGNEPMGGGKKSYLGEFVNYWKNKDNRRVYSGGAGEPVIPENQYHNIPKPRIQLWSSGLNSIINNQPPRTDYDWSDRLLEFDRPVVSHEIGQWCVYPSFKEAEKYDGVLKATNFEIFRRSLEAQKMSHLADSFLLASGKLQALCYKAEIEAALRTPGFGGFQLLGLHDFPGQGTALVGVLDPFWEEKGYITPQEYSRFCNFTVPLARMKKRIFTNNEIFETTVEVSHYGEAPIYNCIPKWKITDQFGETVQSGKFVQTDITLGNGIQLGTISMGLASITAPKKLNLEVKVNSFSNSWDFWVYPGKYEAIAGEEKILIVSSLDQLSQQFLKQGGSVLLTLTKGTLKPEYGGNIAIGFSSIFWNTAWTHGKAPHTLGILCNPRHPAFADFPTEYHSNWQWWDAMSHSGAIILSSFPEDIKPIVRVIDDWFTNRPLALIFEAKVGEGKLLVSGIDLQSNLANRPEAQQLLFSLKKYMTGNDFNPVVELSAQKVEELIKK